MAINTAEKRFSMIGLGLPWSKPLPLPSGGFDRAGRFQLVAIYTIPVSIFWTGLNSTDWSFAGNWNPAGVPDKYTKCNFSSGTFRACALTEDSECYSLLLAPLWNRFLTLGAWSITVVNDVDILGGGIQRGNSAFLVGGDFIQLGGIVDFNDAGPAIMAIAGNLDVQSGGLWFVPQLIGHTITVGGNLSFDLLNLVADGTWYLTVTGDAVATNVNVAYCDASGGTRIDASGGTNTDSGNNLNWLFEAVAAAAVSPYYYLMVGAR